MRTAFLAVAVSLLLTPAGVAAQSRWSLELTTDAALPTENFGPAELEFGVGSGANIRYRFQPHLAAYAGWETHHFWTDDSVMDLDVEDTGYTFGVRFEHAFEGDRLADGGAFAWWLRAGGLVNHIELETESGAAAGDSDHGLGWEAAIGLAWPLGRRVAIAPGVRYRRLTREVVMGGVPDNVALAYAAAGLSIVVRF